MFKMLKKIVGILLSSQINNGVIIPLLKITNAFIKIKENPIDNIQLADLATSLRKYTAYLPIEGKKFIVEQINKRFDGIKFSLDDNSIDVQTKFGGFNYNHRGEVGKIAWTFPNEATKKPNKSKKT